MALSSLNKEPSYFIAKSPYFIYSLVLGRTYDLTSSSILARYMGSILGKVCMDG